MDIERFKTIPNEEIEKLHQEALEINKLVDELKEQDNEISAQEASERIISEREISDLDKEKFAKGWGERMMREILAEHPAIEKVEEAPKETDEQRKTDAFLDFERGRLGVQFTFVGFEERGANDLKNKFKSVLEKETVTYRGRQEVPLTMIRSNEKKFLEAFSSWESEGRKGRPIDYLANKNFLANEFLKTMAVVLEHRYQLKKRPEDIEWASYLLTLYQKNQKMLKARAN